MTIAKKKSFQFSNYCVKNHFSMTMVITKNKKLFFVHLTYNNYCYDLIIAKIIIMQLIF